MTPRKLWLLTLLALAGLSAACKTPNVVVILLDDMHPAALAELPYVTTMLQPEAVTFPNAVVSTALCCPSRVSLLTGQYAHQHGMVQNGPLEAWDPASSLATWLHDAGWTTGLVGKYLNPYTGPEVPPGWDRFVGLIGAYQDYTLAVDGELIPSAPGDYSTDVLRDYALDFIDAHADVPFFLYVAPIAPHKDAIPAPRHAGLYANEPDWRPPNWCEADTSDKSALFRWLPTKDPAGHYPQDDERQHQLEALQAADEAIEAIRERLRAHALLYKTAFIFMSDQGIAWGEHRWFDKEVPYEEALRTSLVVAYPGMTDRCLPDGCVDDSLILAPCDTTATIAQLTGITPGPGVGVSYVPQLQGVTPPAPRTDLLVEYAGGWFVPPYTGVRAPAWKYVRWDAGFRELYDLVADPYELDNLLITDPTNPVVQDMAATLEARRAVLVAE